MTIDIEILQILHYNLLLNRKEIAAKLQNAPSDATLKRLIAEGVQNGDI